MEPSPTSETGAPGDGARCGMVAVVGRANVGKSTLINHLLGEKVSIVSPVAQTTRNLIRGILTEPRGQLVFLDTPGMHKSSSDLGKVMNRVARAAIEGVDVVALLLDASAPPRQEDEGWMRRLMRESSPCFAVLNKSDKGTRYADAHRETWSRMAAELVPGREATWFTTSAKHGEGVKELVEAFFRQVPPGPYLFPADVLTDFPRMIAVGDIIREKLLRHLHEELPHSIAVFVDTIGEEDDHWDVQATIYVQRHSQKGIVIGNKGRLIRATRRASEKELGRLYERDVTVKLWVKVEKDWPRNFWFLKKLGYAG